jgi:Restriction endonuclease
MIEWDRVSATNFEHFVHYFLGKTGFANREWYGRGGGDGGRDIVADKFESLPFNIGYHRKWIFQCKRWKKMPTSNQIFNEIDTARQHNPDFWVLVVPLNPTASFIDFFNRIQTNYSFKIILLSRAILEEILHSYPESFNILENGTLLQESDSLVGN